MPERSSFEATFKTFIVKRVIEWKQKTVSRAMRDVPCFREPR